MNNKNKNQLLEYLFSFLILITTIFTSIFIVEPKLKAYFGIKYFRGVSSVSLIFFLMWTLSLISLTTDFDVNKKEKKFNLFRSRWVYLFHFLSLLSFLFVIIPVSWIK